ncbi:MAG: hypothetical protein RSD68_03655 [Oscillospiraceae bacterium]
MFNLGKTNAGFTLVQTNLLSFVTVIPKAIFGLIGLTRNLGMSAVAATGLNGVLKVLNISPVMLAISANITAPTEADKLKLQILQAALTLRQDLLKTETERLLLKQSKKVKSKRT